jgi:hypothetical protein
VGKWQERGKWAAGQLVGSAVWEAAQNAPWRAWLALLVTTGAGVWGALSDLPGVAVFVLALGAAAASIWLVNGVLYLTDQRRTRALQERRGKAAASGFRESPKPPASTGDLARDVIEGVHLRIGDLMGEGRPIIRNKTFRNCDLEGPAIIAGIGTGMEWAHNSFVEGQDQVFWEREKGWATGLIAMDGCLVIGCRVAGIGLVGTSEQVRRWKGLPPSAQSKKKKRK